MSDYIYGTHAVQGVLESGRRRVGELLIDESRREFYQEMIRKAQGLGVKVRIVPREVLQSRCPDGRHQGILARLSAYAYRDLGELLAQGPPGRRVVLVLDGVSDPRNLGAVLRCAGAFGADFLVIPKDRAAGLNSAAAKVAAGAAEYVPVARVTNLVRAVKKLKEDGFWIYVLEPRGESSLHDQELRGDVALILGREDKGVRPLVKRCADASCRLLADGPTPSMNVASAAACALYEVFRQRVPPKPDHE